MYSYELHQVTVKQAVMRGPTRVKRKESEKPFEAQNDLILTKI